jgi:hypothetical protein
VSLAALPALLSPVHDAAVQPVAILHSVGPASPSSSAEGLVIDQMVAATRRELDRVVDQADQFVPNLTFALRPQQRTVHRARVTVRDAPLPYAGGPSDFSHLDDGQYA